MTPCTHFVAVSLIRLVLSGRVSYDLQIVLIKAMERWEELVGGVVSCPTKFDTKDLFKTSRELS